MFFFKKEKAIIKKTEAYLDEIDVCRDRFLECIFLFVRQEAFDPQTAMVDRVHAAESRADDIRRGIEFELYHKALIPESREDILFLLEAFDSIPNSFQNISYNLSCEKIVIPQPIKEDILLFVKKNLEAYQEARTALSGFLYRREILDRIKRRL